MSIDNNNSSTSAQHIVCHYRSKYEKWYWTIIYNLENRKAIPSRYEKHHPVPAELHPKGWRGSEVNWTVKVTPREHFILHLLLVKTGEFNSYALKRFVGNFNHPESRNEFTTNLAEFWKGYMDRKFIPHNKGKKNLPYVTDEYRRRVGNGGRGRLNNPKLRCKPWLNFKATEASIELWRMADQLHERYQTINKKKGTNGSYRLAQAMGIKMCETIKNMVLAFNGQSPSLCPNGKPWVPEEDPDWIEFSTQCDDIV